MAEHVHEWLPTRNQATLPTEFFGWCECDETISLRELCKRANATERLGVEEAMGIDLLIGNAIEALHHADYGDVDNYLSSIWERGTLRAYADILEGK